MILDYIIGAISFISKFIVDIIIIGAIIYFGLKALKYLKKEWNKEN